MCRVCKVSRSGFYAWLKRPESRRQQRHKRVTEAVEATYIGFKKRYGSPRIALELNAQGIDCCVNHVAKLMQEKGLRARNGKGFKYRARIESKTNVSDNLLAREFKADAPNRYPISPISKSIEHGFIWLWYWTCSHEKSLAGAWIITCEKV